MAFIKKSEARAAFQQYAKQNFVRKSADQVLRENVQMFSTNKEYDIFLSHCREDAEVIGGVKILLEKEGVSVYVDWIEDPQLHRTNVTPKTAAMLRLRMRACKSMLFATSEASPNSKWMPWELGYFDGLKEGQIAVLPLLEDCETTFTGQEYLGLYPVVERLPVKNSSKTAFVARQPDQYLFLHDFAAGSREYRPFS